jgi:cytochrome c oxidase assembly protein Cox11
MKRTDLSQMTAHQLVERFATLGLEQDRAEDDIPKFNRLYGEMRAVEDELKARPGDQRRALLQLFTHRNAQVRLTAAKATLAVAPQEARSMLEWLADSQIFPQAGGAGMCLSSLDRGIFKPT